MDEVAIFGKAVFVFEGDESDVEYSATVVTYAGELWLVANWTLVPSTGGRRPVQLVPLVQMGAETQPGQTDLRLVKPVPRELLTSRIPPEMIQAYGVIDVLGPDQGSPHIH